MFPEKLPTAEDILLGFSKQIQHSIEQAQVFLEGDIASTAPIKEKAAREMALVRTKLQEAQLWTLAALDLIQPQEEESADDEE